MPARRETRFAAGGLVLSLLLVLAALVAVPGAYGLAHHRQHGHHHRRAHAGTPVDHHHNAVIFVHGYEGSGSQFESQQMRLTSNGYPQSYIAVLEYDSSQFAASLQTHGNIPPAQEAPLFARLDRLIAHIKKVTHRPKVDLLAHSLGTKLMQDYLNSSKRRAARVAHYVNIDGQTANRPPGGVRTLAVWGTRGPLSDQPGRRIKGAKNVSIPDSTHVQTATSPLTFWWFFKFFNHGKPPKTTRIVRQKGMISIAGRDVNFPQNTGLSGATVQLWNINQKTGHRIGSKPIHSFAIGSSGRFGPVEVKSGRRYEFAELRSGFPTHHFYYEPFIHSDHLIRLLESDALRSAGGPPDPRSVAMVIIRYKELWGDQGSHSDVLKINGLRVCNATTCPLSKEVNALFAADFDHDGKSNTHFTWAPYQQLGYFISSVDVFAPAASPPTGEVTVSLRSRGKGPVRTIRFPNWPGTTDDVTVQLNDFDQNVGDSTRGSSSRPGMGGRGAWPVWPGSGSPRS